MSNIQGIVSSSLGAFMQNVTMSFFTASGGIIYTTYTDVNGIYTQSVDNNFTGSLRPTGSGYQFFYSFNNSGSFDFTASASDRTLNWTGVKNYTSGSGTGPNPYIILDHEDMHNVRFRTGSGTAYRLGADIDLSYFSNWMPIPDDSTGIFRGSINGGNYTISNMTINNLSLPETATSRYYGLFGHFSPSGSQHNINFNSCSINMLNTFKLHSPGNFKYFGIFAGQYDGITSNRQNLYNIRVKNSTVKYISEPSAGAGVFPVYLGGIVGYTRDEQVDIRMYSCSVENSTIMANLQTGSATTRVGGLGIIPPYQFTYGPCVFHSFVKNSYIFGCSGINVSVGAMDGLSTNYQDCYALNNTISSSAEASGFMFGGRGVAQTTRCYVAGTKWGNTPVSQRYPFAVTSSGWTGKTAGYNYFESGTFDYNANANLVIGVTGSVSSSMVTQSNYTTWDFDYTWEIKPDFQNSYPYLLGEPDAIPRIKGYISNSLGNYIENVPIYFSNDRPTAYTDINGAFRSFYSGSWSGSLSASLDNYQFFTAPNNSGSKNYNNNINDIYNATAVKNFSSGSGTTGNPYIIIDHEDLNNMRYRTGSSTNSVINKLGANIDLSYFTSWKVISPTLPCNTSLYGNNYTIKNLNINTQSFQTPTTTGTTLYIGLFGYVSNGVLNNIILNSCSIDLTGWTPPFGTTIYNIGLLFGRYDIGSPISEIKIKNSTVKWVAGPLPHNNRLRFSAIGGYPYSTVLNLVTSCSVENSTIWFENLTTGPNGWANGIYSGILFGDNTNILFQKNYIKNCYYKIIPHSTDFYTPPTYIGAFAGGTNLFAQDNYILSCSISATNMTASAFSNSMHTSLNSLNNYVALINFMDTTESKRIPFAKSGVSNFSYYESGTYSTTAGGITLTGVTGSTTTDMKTENYYNKFNFIQLWDKDTIISRPSFNFYNYLNVTASSFDSRSVSSFNCRNLITASVTTGINAKYVKVTLKSNPNVDWSFVKCGILDRIGTTFSASKAERVTFNGVTSSVVYAGQDLVSDAIRFDIEQGKDYFVHIVSTGASLPILKTPFATASFTINNSGDYSVTLNYTSGITPQTSSYCVASLTGINITTSSIAANELNYGYPYFNYQTFPIAATGLTLYYDSRIGYVSESNTWTDLSSNGVNAQTIWTYPTQSHLYFGNQFGGQSSASFAGVLVSESFGIEIWTAPTTQSGQLTLFTTTSGSFPRIESYILSNSVYFGYQGTGSIPMDYISSSNIINQNKFNHIAFYVSGTKCHLWANGIFFNSMSVYTGSWNGGTIGILNTSQTNPYFGYIDVFKVWNGTSINVSETNTYHNNRKYIANLPNVNNPL